MNEPETVFTACPKCNGPVWDNRQRKALGEIKATAPDFKCRDATVCRWIQWPKSDRPTPKPMPGVDSGPAADPWPTIHALYGRCEHEATKTLALAGQDPKDEANLLLLAVLTGSYTLLLASVMRHPERFAS